jgi:antirestriction protein ArdC
MLEERKRGTERRTMEPTPTKTPTADIYTRITDHIVAALERYDTLGLNWLRAGYLPVNGRTRKPYRGVNTLALWVTAAVAGYHSGEWATFNQWRELGTPVRSGEKATPVVFWKPLAADTDESDGDVTPADDRPRARFVTRGYSVFNREQTHAVELPPEPPTGSLRAAESLVTALRPVLKHGGEIPYYSPTEDYVQLPRLGYWSSAQTYYAVLCHELTHWTGAAHRLNRDLNGRFGSDAYAVEELIAELGAAFACGALGVEGMPHPDHTRYLASWLAVLRADSRAIFAAASKAQQAVDWMFSQAGEVLAA